MRCSATRSSPRTRWPPWTKGWRRIVSEMGIEFSKPEALELFRAGFGQRASRTTKVFLDPEFVLAQVAMPCRVRPRCPQPRRERRAHRRRTPRPSGVYGPPFVRRGNERRDATLADYRNFGEDGAVVQGNGQRRRRRRRAERRPLDSRHLDMLYATMTLTDKIYMRLS
ncbi:MAG: trimethylamine methyltransferase family protein [Candidatus Nanopelagicales bacterium]